MSQHVTCGPVFSTSEQGPLAGSQLKCPLGQALLCRKFTLESTFVAGGTLRINRNYALPQEIT